MEAPATNTAEAPAAPARSSVAAAGRAPALASCFADMRLKVGDQVHLEPPRRVADGRATVMLLGWLEGQSVIVGAPQNAAGRLVLQEGDSVSLELRAQACGEKSDPTADGSPRRQYGVEFKHLQPKDRLILGSLVWYQMYEHPRSVT